MPRFEIEIQADVDVPEPILDQLVTAVLATLQNESIIPPLELTLLLTDDDRIRALNHQFLGLDKTTDVLSFPSGEVRPLAGDSPLYLGDIVISKPYAERQAASAGHKLSAELQLLAVHGTLHLLGYDHADLDKKQAMWAAQTAVLAQLDIPHVTPSEK